MYAAFIDLRKAFDSVDRASLFLTFVKAGLSGPFLNAIKAVVSCVRVHNKVAVVVFILFYIFLWFVWCQTGVHSESSVFSLFVNEIAIGMEAVGKHGIQLQPGLVELFLLLFADDLALLSSISMVLQNQLNRLNSVCRNTHCPSILKNRKSWYSEKVGFLAKAKSSF